MTAVDDDRQEEPDRVSYRGPSHFTTARQEKAGTGRKAARIRQARRRRNSRIAQHTGASTTVGVPG
ncbi:hypothetical protein ACFU6M_38135, partial [Streptomyces bottropensis]|uniref:hypothetical protein n=1 Tax=Streptomyces bottropensis TaxID=42235 RepID=UPI003689C416